MLSRVAALMFSRFTLMPITAFALLKAGVFTGLIPSADKLLWFILLMQACMPSAQNTVVILQLADRPAAATAMARLISTMYISAVFPMAFLLSAILQYVKL